MKYLTRPGRPDADVAGGGDFAGWKSDAFGDIQRAGEGVGAGVGAGQDASQCEGAGDTGCAADFKHGVSLCAGIDTQQ